MSELSCRQLGTRIEEISDMVATVGERDGMVLACILAEGLRGRARGVTVRGGLELGQPSLRGSKVLAGVPVSRIQCKHISRGLRCALPVSAVSGVFDPVGEDINSALYSLAGHE